MGDIFFYSRKDNGFGFLSNYWRAWQEENSVRYPTNEHYYQSKKAKYKPQEIWIASAPNPYDAMCAGRSLRQKDLVDDWEDIKFDVMRRGLFLKFSQNHFLKKKLLDTVGDRLHEDSPTDLIWGMKGKDMLGKLLMETREKLRDDKL